MHIECSACGALFDEDVNIRCPRCQTLVDQSVSCCGSSGGCGGCGSCSSKGTCHIEKAELN